MASSVQFHHVVIFGDLNYRTLDMQDEQALSFISRRQLQALRWHDGLVDDMRAEKIFYRCRDAWRRARRDENMPRDRVVAC